jgi:ubiquinone/menaquinone biosynthesis C-methylase UbiE
MNQELKIKEWDESYSRKENHIFYPKEEVVKFLNRFVTKRTGTNKFEQILNTSDEKLNALDLGCGIGRQTILFEEFQINGYGVDISSNAIAEAKILANQFGFEMGDRFNTITNPTLPFSNDFFQIGICDSVLDNMNFEIAKEYISELDRVITNYLFITLIGSNAIEQESTEKIVQDNHEFGTVQSYFNIDKIHSLIENSNWKIKWINIVDEQRLEQNSNSFLSFNSRFHIVLSKA